MKSVSNYRVGRTLTRRDGIYKLVGGSLTLKINGGGTEVYKVAYADGGGTTTLKPADGSGWKLEKKRFGCRAARSGRQIIVENI